MGINTNSISNYFAKEFDYYDELPFEITRVHFPKDSYIIEKGEFEKNLYFLVDGIVEIGMNKNNNNFIIEFFFANRFFSSIIPLITGEPSDTYLLAYTECTIDVVKYDDLLIKSKSSLIINQLLRLLAEKALLERHAKEKKLSILNAEEMYIDLVKNRPILLQQITVKKIAEYLGIRPQSMSRIRKQISQSDKE